MWKATWSTSAGSTPRGRSTCIELLFGELARVQAERKVAARRRERSGG